MNETLIRELNQFLKGRYMGIHQYEHLIGVAKSERVKRELQHIQQETKEQASKVAARIQDLGGMAADDVGFIGQIQEAIKNVKGFPDTDEGILKEALRGESKYAIQKSHEIVAGDLDETSTKLIDDILEQDRRHLDRLTALLNVTVPAGV